MRRFEIYVVIIILLLIAAFAAYHYIFTIYEVTFSVEPKSLSADYKSTAVIEVIPVNSLGWKAPLRNSSAQFEIKEGKDLVEIVTEDNENGKLILRAKDKPGKVVIHIKSANALLPSPVEIIIHQNAA